MRFVNSATPRWVIIVGDLVLSMFALGLSYLIRFDLNTNLSSFKNEWEQNWKSVLLYLVIKLSVFQLFSIHKGLIRHTSAQDTKRILNAALCCTGIFIGISIYRATLLNTTYLFPSSIILLEFIISIFFLVGSRFTLKLFYFESNRSSIEPEQVLIFGAGTMGVIAKNTIENDSKIHQKIIGFIDENPKLVGNRINGTRVFAYHQLIEIIRQNQVQRVIVAIANPKKESLKNLLDLCLEHNIKAQRVQNPSTWVNGALTTKKISKIPIDDLLGRESIQLNQEALSTWVQENTILVTGAAGSIGSGIVKEIAKLSPKKLVLIDQAESDLYELQTELGHMYKNAQLHYLIADIRDKKQLREIFEREKPSAVFHAAAYKHVPLMEDNPNEAIKTNIQGTKNITDISIAYGIRKFVFISTDKAVNPTNIMGASKRIAEMYIQSKNGQSSTQFITTRFGNVLGSNGSVIPLFQKQIESGGPITLTDDKITRYFMTIPEACQLVLEAFIMGQGGEIFVFDMGEPMKIIDLAKKMIALNGYEVDKDIEIKITGLRPGEKMYEELLADLETTLPTHHPKILIAQTRNAGEAFETQLNELLTLENEVVEKVKIMKEIVPEFISENSSFSALDHA